MSLPPLITLEEHFLSEVIGASGFGPYSEQLKHVPELEAKLLDLGPIRLAEMDKGAVKLQVISHGPGAGGVEPSKCSAANDQLAKAIKANPDRFAGFAVLPMNAPEDAARELRRCVKELGFVGALVDNHVDGVYYDDRRFWSIFKEAAELDVPIYLHPTFPTGTGKEVYQGNYSPGAEISMGTSGFGWHQDTALHILKLFAAGLFDEVPKLKLIIGHFGEMLPFMLERVEKLSPRWGARERKFREVWDEQIYITTSGVWSVAPMACILRNTKIENILYSVDYPFEKNENGLKWITELKESGLVTEEQLAMIAHKNAEALLRVKAVR